MNLANSCKSGFVVVAVKCIHHRADVLSDNKSKMYPVGHLDKERIKHRNSHRFMMAAINSSGLKCRPRSSALGSPETASTNFRLKPTLMRSSLVSLHWTFNSGDHPPSPL